MLPFLFSIGSFKVPSFFFFIMVATLVATFYGIWVSKKKGLPIENVIDMGMLGLVSGVLGARIFHILVEAPAYYWAKPARVFQFWRGGFVSWGGFLGICIAFFFFFRARKLSVAVYFDLLAVMAPIVKFFVRVGCLLTGCCFGKPTAVAWAITYTNPDSTAFRFFPNIPLHPTQVYSMMHAAILFVLGNWYYFKKKSIDGQTACILAMGWTLPRAFIEFFRADSDRGLYFGGHVSTGQVMSFLLFLTFLGIFLYRNAQNKQTTP